jgi:16S rRNA (guanine527-N7)-methyltransferase
LNYDNEPVEAKTIAGLMGPFAQLTPELLEQISTYLALLLKWNAKVNLTAVRDPREMVTRHFGESFFAAERLLSVHAVRLVHGIHPPSETTSVIDVGTGAGFPGLPLAMFSPKAHVVLIESHAKKVAFLNEVISALGLRNAKVARQRAEEYPGKAELVTMRAVEMFERSIHAAHRLVGEGGRLALMIGAAQVRLAKAEIGEMAWSEAMPLPGSQSRVLLVGSKGIRGDKVE